MACVRNTRKIYCANISRHAREKDIGHLFEDAGRIASLEHKGNFAFIEYQDEAAAEHAIRRFHDHDFMGKRLIVKPYRYRGGDFRYNPDAAPNPAKFRGPRSVSYRLYITGLDDSTSWQDVKDFARTGGRSVCYTDVYTRHSKKEGVIEYYRREDFEYALRYLDRARLNGCRVRVFDRQPDGDKDEEPHANRGGRSRSRSRDRGRGNDNYRGGRGRDDYRHDRGRSPRDRRDDRDRDRGRRDNDKDYGRYDRDNKEDRGGKSPRDSHDRDRGNRSPRDNKERDIKSPKGSGRFSPRDRSPRDRSRDRSPIDRNRGGGMDDVNDKEENKRDISDDKGRGNSRSKSPYNNGNRRQRSNSPNGRKNRSVSRSKSPQ